MTARMFRLTQIHQRIDEHLRLEKRKRLPDPLVITRLTRLKLRARSLLNRITRVPQFA